MPEFRPFIGGKLGPIPNPKTRYVIGDAKAIEYTKTLGLFAERIIGEVNINENTRIESNTGNTFGYGNVTVATGPERHIFKNVAGTRDFIAAIVSERQRLYEIAHPWHEKLGLEDLADYSVIIPHIPFTTKHAVDGAHGMIGYHTAMIARGERPERAHYKNGDWVQISKVLGRTFAGNIIAPISGKIIHIDVTPGSSYLRWDPSTAWVNPASSHGAGRYFITENSFAIITPLKSVTISDSCVQDALTDVVTNLKESIQLVSKMSVQNLKKHFESRTGIEQDPEGARTEILASAHADLKAISGAKPHFIRTTSIMSIPELPSREWLDQNGMNSGIPYYDPD